MEKNQVSASYDALTRERILEALGREGDAVSVVAFETCGSTNDEAKKLASEGILRPVLITADQQTAGRGRMGRSFYSPAQTGLYCSLLYPTVASLQNAVSVTGAAAVAVLRALRTLTGRQAGIKWVNDLYLDGKKVCGILTEALTGVGQTYLVIGIGINLTTDVFPTELSAIAGAVGGEPISRATLLAAIWKELLPYLQDPSNRTWLDDYRAHSTVLGKQIEWSRGEARWQGVAEEIDGDGALIVRLPSGERELLRTGEISVRVTADNP